MMPSIERGKARIPTRLAIHTECIGCPWRGDGERQERDPRGRRRDGEDKSEGRQDKSERREMDGGDWVEGGSGRGAGDEETV